MALRNFIIDYTLAASNPNVNAQMAVIPQATKEVLKALSCVHDVDFTVRQIGNTKVLGGQIKYKVQVRIPQLGNEDNLIVGSALGLTAISPIFENEVKLKIVALAGGTNSVSDITVPIQNALEQEPPGLVTDVLPECPVALIVVPTAITPSFTVYQLYVDGTLNNGIAAGVKLSLVPLIQPTPFGANWTNIVRFVSGGGGGTGTVNIGVYGKMDMISTFVVDSGVHTHILTSKSDVYTQLATADGTDISTLPLFSQTGSGVPNPSRLWLHQFSEFPVGAPNIIRHGLGIGHSGLTGSIAKSIGINYAINPPVPYVNTSFTDITLTNNTGSALTANQYLGEFQIFRAAITV